MTAHHAKQLIAYRRSQQLTQEALAEILGVTAATISRWENDAQSPGPEHIVSLEKLLGIQRMNSLEEWCFRVNRSAGFELLFDSQGFVVAVSDGNLIFRDLARDQLIGLRVRDLLPSSAASDAEAEYRRLNYHAHRAKLFSRQIRLIQYSADLLISGFSGRILSDFWPIVTSEDETYCLMCFVRIGPISDPNWRGAFRISSYRTFSMPETNTY